MQNGFTQTVGFHELSLLERLLGLRVLITFSGLRQIHWGPWIDRLGATGLAVDGGWTSGLFICLVDLATSQAPRTKPNNNPAPIR